MAQDTPSNFKMFLKAHSPMLKHRAQAAEHAVDDVLMRRMNATAPLLERVYYYHEPRAGVEGKKVPSATEYPGHVDPKSFTISVVDANGDGMVSVLVNSDPKPKVLCTPEGAGLGEKIAAEIRKAGRFISRIEVVVGGTIAPKPDEFF